MGGLGSGRPSGSGRAKVEACRSIDVNRLHREGCLRVRLMASANGRATASKRHPDQPACRTDRLHLTYQMRIGGRRVGGRRRKRPHRPHRPAASAELGPISSARAS